MIASIRLGVRKVPSCVPSRVGRCTAVPLVLHLAFLAAVLASDFSVADHTDSLETIISRIKAYESLYDRARIRLRYPEVVEQSEQWLAYSGTGRRIEFVYDGNRMRSTEGDGSSNVDAAQKIRVANGSGFKEWTRSENGEPDEGNMREIPAGLFGREWFVRHSGISAIDLSDIEILENTDTHVELLFTPRPETRVHVRYERFGEYLRTLSYEPTFTDPATGEKSMGTRYYFFYRELTKPDLANAGPYWMIMYTDIHQSMMQLDIQSIDFDPMIADDEFDFDFPSGTHVDNPVFEGPEGQVPHALVYPGPLPIAQK